MRTASTLLLALFLTTTLSAAPAAAGEEKNQEKNYFSVSSKELAEADRKDTQTLMGALKRRAVIHFLAPMMQSRFAAVESQINVDFAERYVVDYAVSRPQGKDRATVVLSGHVDLDGLRRWANVAETKAAGSGPRPLLVISSDFAALDWQPRNSGTRLKENSGGQALLAGFGSAFQKVNGKLATSDLPSLSLASAPSTGAEIEELAQAAGTNHTGALWVHVEPCPSCGGSRLDARYYTFGQSRASLTESYDVALDGKEYLNGDRVKKALAKSFEDFGEKLDELLSRGALQSTAHRLQISNLPVRATSKMYKALTQLDFVSQATLKSAGASSAEFEVLSPLGPQELLQKLTTANLGTCSLTQLRVGSSGIEGRCSDGR